ncbi:hypothetical protein [Cellulomonas sp. RIT-PI-Y]|uniref:hypothetical protein n=1 Tax=Cellulomonas sp. RIT-PI-Y TaxID=3035297 RepID=UPI0021D81B5F|nr:hypothetical protein [Cellulomonas sp. RIT-PI-Y]
MFNLLAAAVEPGSGVDSVFSSASGELNVAVPAIVGGVAVILGLAWVIRSIFIANKAAKKASNQIGS